MVLVAERKYALRVPLAVNIVEGLPLALSMNFRSVQLICNHLRVSASFWDIMRLKINLTRIAYWWIFGSDYLQIYESVNILLFCHWNFVRWICYLFLWSLLCFCQIYEFPVLVSFSNLRTVGNLGIHLTMSRTRHATRPRLGSARTILNLLGRKWANARNWAKTSGR